MKQNSTYRRLIGFTLIELLTVITIIAILAAIIMPTVGYMRRKANMATQASNLKQIFSGLASYTQDNEESYPLIGSGGSIAIKSDGDISSVDPKYFGGEPSARKIFKDPFDNREDDPAAVDWNVSYGLNRYLVSSDTFNGKLANINDSANKYLMMPAYTNDPEVAANWQGTSKSMSLFDDNPTQVKTIAGQEGLNVLFANGGVRAVKLEDLKKLKANYHPDQSWEDNGPATP